MNKQQKANHAETTLVYYYNHHKTRKAYSLSYYRKHREKINERKRWRRKNDPSYWGYCPPEKRKNRLLKTEKLKILETNKRIKIPSKELKNHIMNHYGGKCACCGEVNIKLLTIDHKDNDGKNYVSKSGQRLGGSALYRFLILKNYPTNVQAYCFSCNMGKYQNGGICPHKE